MLGRVMRPVFTTLRAPERPERADPDDAKSPPRLIEASEESASDIHCAERDRARYDA